MIALPDPQEVRRFQVRIVELLGLYFDESKFGNLARILHNRLLSRGGTYTQYIESLSDAPANDEIGSLARELTVTETYFLRNIEQFKAYAAVALPQRAAAAGNGQCIRILSAGCASGDEAYSLAIAAREYFPALAENISITAVDVNPAMLQKAARAHYTNWSLRECPDELKARWFKSDGDTFILNDAIRRMVKFEARNLTHDDADFWQPLRFDIVFCRNVLMYFNGEQMQAAVRRIARAMAPGGYLFLGHAETLRAISNDFHLCHSHETFYYQRKDQLASPAPVPIPMGSPVQAGWQPASTKLDTGWITAIQEASERIHALIPQESNEAIKRPALASRPVANLHRALEFLHNEQFDLTLEQIRDLPIEQANAPDVLLLKAVSLSHSGALAQAEAVCRELLLRDALSAGAHYILALCSEGAGDVEGAIEHDQAAIYLDPGFAMPRFHIGLLARKRGDRQSAHRDLSEALVLLQKEDASRVLLFGGGFKREALIDLCRAELTALGESA
ncbi:methylase of chemotaxis methyl-accepting protein [Herbaspirillum sp. CF444]|uniref:CheR family methyltransferase n=1 Tax=Herbaspirillum sp. CF444 TaxID=1144319 RepID=UPI00027283B5|nr:protein-glutamate O-methyltransferase CheR [Herbaspirillum sp. CF444]EJL90873.1 methylase of chemotaxis methyl-accepting protein [Herbaspirillum sp. CF444]